MKIQPSDLPAGQIRQFRKNQNIPILVRRLQNVDALINSSANATVETIESIYKVRQYLLANLKFRISRDFPEPLTTSEVKT